MNLAWRDAMAEVGGAFNKTEQSAGWAESFTTWQLAVLQRPWKKGDREGKLACQALFTALGEACKAGELAHRTLTVDVQVSVLTQAVRSRSWVTDWEGRESEGARRDRLWRIANPQPTTKTEQREQIQISAEAFAAWLAANEIEPSRHVGAWFDAVGAGALRLVEEAINTDSELHKAWMAEAKRGKVRAALFLGVVLWAIGGDEPSPQTDRAIVEGWAEKLIAATVEKWRSGRAVCPLNPVTLIEIEGQPRGLKWVMTLEDADAFLESHALAFKCSDVLAYWRGEPSPYSDESPAEPGTPSPTKETTAQRNSRWLGVVDEEERTGSKVGAQARAIRRIVADESEGEHKVKKGIQAAKAERAKKYRDGGVTTMSRKRSKPATPFDGLRKRT